MLTTIESIITITVVVLGTLLTRALPFLIFPANKKPPAFITYLGTVLPYAVIGLLVVYCLKDSFYRSMSCLPEALAIAFIVLLHHWKNNTLLSIGLGTAFYMFLVQICF